MHTTLCKLASTVTTIALGATAAAQTTLVAHYELNETSGTVAADSSGNGNDGSYTGGVLLGQPGNCPSSTAVEFNGFDAYVDIPPSPSLDALLSDFTVAAWVNLNVDQLMRIFSSQRQACNGALAAWAYGPLNGGGIRFTTLGVQDYNQASSVTPGVWHHIAVVFDAAFQAHFYLDGAPQGTIGGTAPANASAIGWFIGVLDLTCASEFFNGRIDDVQVYAGSASTADIQFLFQNPCSVIGGGGAQITLACDPANNHSGGTYAKLDDSDDSGPGVLHLECTDGPVGQFGYFLVSATLNDPGTSISNGMLCLGSPIGRYAPAAGGALNSIGQFDGSGVLQSLVGNSTVGSGYDVLAALPQPPGGTIMSGDTWYFQCWYRDGNRSNFSNTACVTF
jgi:hypothetical protein